MCGTVSRDLQGGANSVSLVDGSQIWHLLAGFMAPWPCWGGLRKWAMASACLDARHFSFSQYATDAFQAATVMLELRRSEFAE